MRKQGEERKAVRQNALFGITGAKRKSDLVEKEEKDQASASAAALASQPVKKIKLSKDEVLSSVSEQMVALYYRNTISLIVGSV